MVKVILHDPLENKDYSFYLDERLKKNLDNKVKGALNKKDEDYVICVDGGERMGKSVFAMQIGKYIDPTLNLNRICFTAEEFKDAILSAKKGECVIFDEAYGGLGSAGALSKTNKMLKSLMTEMGQKNLFVIIVLPSFFLLEKYPALWRTRVLFHVFKDKRGRKGFFRMFNGKKKKILYQRGRKDYNYTIKQAKSSFRGRFYNKYVVNEDAYRKKKDTKLKETYEIEEEPKKNKYLEQRNTLFYIMNKKLGVSQSEIAELVTKEGYRITQPAINAIIGKYGGTG